MLQINVASKISFFVSMIGRITSSERKNLVLRLIILLIRFHLPFSINILLLHNRCLVITFKIVSSHTHILSFIFCLQDFHLLHLFKVWILTCRMVEALWNLTLIIKNIKCFHNNVRSLAILQNSILAKLIFSFFGMFILAPISIWKRSHDYHHQHNCKLYTSSIGSFPLLTKKTFLASTKFEQRMYLFVRHPLTIALGYIFAFLWGMTLQSIIKSSGKHIDSYGALIVHFGISGIVFYF